MLLEALGAASLLPQAGRLLTNRPPTQICTDGPKAQVRHQLTHLCTVSLHRCVCSGHFARCLASQESEHPEKQTVAVKMKEGVLLGISCQGEDFTLH